MKTLVLPAAGSSSRFPGLKPKPFLTMPSGRLMVHEAIQGFHPEDFDALVLIFLKEQAEMHLGRRGLQILRNEIDESGFETKVVLLDKTTSSPAETVARGCEIADVSGSILIKDCDNSFSMRWSGDNAVGFVDLQSIDRVSDPGSKSYVHLSSDCVVDSIVEKVVASNAFCAGAYGFAHVEHFVRSFSEVGAALTNYEVFVSHVVLNEIYRGEQFQGLEVNSYVDWGTQDDFLVYQGEHVTVFCDLDGVLVRNGSKYSPSGWTCEPISRNIEALLELQARSRLHLVITTSRPETECREVKAVLDDIGLHVSQWVFRLPHQQRLLVNDYAPTLPFPSAIGISMVRNAENLADLMGHLRLS